MRPLLCLLQTLLLTWVSVIEPWWVIPRERRGYVLAIETKPWLLRVPSTGMYASP